MVTSQFLCLGVVGIKVAFIVIGLDKATWGFMGHKKYGTRVSHVA